MSLLRRLDAYLIIPAISISGLSLFLLLSSSPELFLPQAVNVILGLILYVIFLSADFRIWPKYSLFFYVLALILLSVIFLLPPVRGAHRWIDFGFFVLQPSEVLKPLIILLYASQLSKIKNLKLNSLLWILLTFLPILLLIFMQPDLGNVIIYVAFMVGLLIIGGINLIYVSAGLSFFLVSTPLIWNFMKDYQKQRIFSFINPGLDPGGAGYNAIQSMIAVGSGGLFGMGLGRGSQSRLLFLPEFQTDFIFASLSESLGLLGGTILLVLYLVLLVRILMFALHSEYLLGRIISVGIFCQLLFQILINVGMNLGILPITGITLPLLSYGGSSVVSTYIGLGIINSIKQSLPNKLLVIR